MFIRIPMSGIDSIITDHFEMFIRDMADETFTEFQNRNCLADKFIIFMPVVMEGDKVSIIVINTLCCNNRSAKVAADIFCDKRRITFLLFGKNIKALFMVFVHRRLNFFKGKANDGFHFIEKSSHESVSEISKVEMPFYFPVQIVAETTF